MNESSICGRWINDGFELQNCLVIGLLAGFKVRNREINEAMKSIFHFGFLGKQYPSLSPYICLGISEWPDK